MSAKAIIIFAWNGVGTAFEQIIWDAQPEFEILLFNFSGNGAVPTLKENSFYHELLNERTEFKGSLIYRAYLHLKDRSEYQYVGWFDDDLLIAVSGINRLLELAQEQGFDAFQPATTSDSFNSHRFTIHRPGLSWLDTDWVEIMCPFYRKEIFDAAAEFYPASITSYGLDVYVYPYVQKLLGMDRTAVIHEVQVKHVRPVTDGDKRFSNGLTSREEGELLRSEILRRILGQHRQLFPIAFLKRVYEYRTFRYNKFKRDLKRWIGYKSR